MHAALGSTNAIDWLIQGLPLWSPAYNGSAKGQAAHCYEAPVRTSARSQQQQQSSLVFHPVTVLQSVSILRAYDSLGEEQTEPPCRKRIQNKTHLLLPPLEQPHRLALSLGLYISPVYALRLFLHDGMRQSTAFWILSILNINTSSITGGVHQQYCITRRALLGRAVLW